MCFSAAASFGSAAILGLISVGAFKKSKTTGTKLLSTVPFFFALQQCIEGFLWYGLSTGQSPELISVATYFYLYFAYIFWPTWIPFVLIRLERDEMRKKILTGCWIGGGLFALVALWNLITVGSVASIADHHIAYTRIQSSIPDIVLFALYGMATVGALLISSAAHIWIIGLLTGAAAVVTYWCYKSYFTSVWCFFAALISIIILESIDTIDQQQQKS